MRHARSRSDWQIERTETMTRSRTRSILGAGCFVLLLALPFLAAALRNEARGRAGPPAALASAGELAPGLFMPFVIGGQGATVPLPTFTPPPLPPTSTATPSPTPTEAPENIPVPNGTFEQGPNGDWDEQINGQSALGSLILQPGGAVDPHMGQFVAWLGGVNDETNTILQTVPVDTELPTRLRFWYQIRSQENSNCVGDEATLSVNNVTLRTYALCSPEETTEWVRELVDLSQFAGDDLTITFSATFDRRQLSSFFVDNVSLRTIP